MLRRPPLALPRTQRPRAIFSRVLGLYAIGMICAGLFVQIAATVSGAQNLLTETMRDALTPDKRLLLLLFGGLIAPLWEETAFRLPLARFHPARVLPAMVLFALLVGYSIEEPARTRFWIAMTIIEIPILAAFFVRSWRARVEAWWERNFRGVLFVLIAAFGLAHGVNYRFPSGSVLAPLAIPLLVMPQLVAGVFLAYVRLKLGFWHGVLLHAGVNTFLLAPVLLFPQLLQDPNKPSPTATPTSTATSTATSTRTRVPARPTKSATP